MEHSKKWDEAVAEMRDKRKENEEEIIIKYGKEVGNAAISHGRTTVVIKPREITVQSGPSIEVEVNPNMLINFLQEAGFHTSREVKRVGNENVTIISVEK